MNAAQVALVHCDANTLHWQPLNAAPVVTFGFRELGTYLFRKPAPGWRLLVDDECLPESVEHAGCWEWSPGFYAGQVAATLEAAAGNATRHHYTFDVSPDPDKLGRDIFQVMVDELRQYDPSLLMGSEPAQSVIGSAGKLHDPWLAFARIRRYAPEFMRALRQVVERPRQALRVTRQQASIAQIRRVDGRTAAVAARSSAVSVFRGTAADVKDIRLDVPAVESTVDCAANRCLLALSRAVLQRVRAIRSELGELVAKERASETATPLANRWPVRRDELIGFERALNTLLRGAPFDRVRRAEVTAAGLTAIAADPTYARAWGRAWRALRDGADTGSEADSVWLSPTWAIYEKWCFLRLSAWLTDRHPNLHWQRDRRRQSLHGVGDGTAIELSLQPRFPAGPDERRERWSVSGEREPDIVLTIRRANGLRFVVFDAKYRVTRFAVLDAMTSAHIYQDSLRIGSVRPTGSLLLVPAPGGAPWLERGAFQDVHRVGIVDMAPGRDPVLPAFVLDLLSGSSERQEGAVGVV